MNSQATTATQNDLVIQFGSGGPTTRGRERGEELEIEDRGYCVPANVAITVAIAPIVAPHTGGIPDVYGKNHPLLKKLM